MIIKMKDGTFDLDNVFCIIVQDTYVILINNELNPSHDPSNDCLSWHDAYVVDYILQLNEDTVKRFIDAISDEFCEISGSVYGRNFINCRFYHGTYNTSSNNYYGPTRWNIDVKLYGPGEMYASENNIKTEEEFNIKLANIQKICEKLNKNKKIVEL